MKIRKDQKPPKTRKCETCGGRGQKTIGGHLVECPKCWGKGWVVVSDNAKEA